MTQAHLWSVRKQLTVLVGALKSSEPAVSVSPFALRANSIADEEEEETEKESSDGIGYSSPLIMQFFQVRLILLTVLIGAVSCSI